MTQIWTAWVHLHVVSCFSTLNSHITGSLEPQAGTTYTEGLTISYTRIFNCRGSGPQPPPRSRVSYTHLVKEGNFPILIKVIYKNPTANFIILNSERLNAFPLKSKTSMSALIASFQLMIILQTFYVRHEPDSLLA